MFNEIQEPQLSVLKLVGAFPVALYNRQEESAISKVTRGAALVSGLHVIDKDTAKQAFERRLAQYQNQTDV